MHRSQRRWACPPLLLVNKAPVTVRYGGGDLSTSEQWHHNLGTSVCSRYVQCVSRTQLLVDTALYSFRQQNTGAPRLSGLTPWSPSNNEYDHRAIIYWFLDTS